MGQFCSGGYTEAPTGVDAGAPQAGAEDFARLVPVEERELGGGGRYLPRSRGTFMLWWGLGAIFRLGSKIRFSEAGFERM